MTITLHEHTVASNWRGIKRPDWADEWTRLYSGVTLNRDGISYSELLAVFDGSKTMVYLTNGGFRTDEVGPIVHEYEGKRAAYRKCVTEFFRKHGIEVTFK